MRLGQNGFGLAVGQLALFHDDRPDRLLDGAVVAGDIIMRQPEIERRQVQVVGEHELADFLVQAGAAMLQPVEARLGFALVGCTFLLFVIRQEIAQPLRQTPARGGHWPRMS